MGEVIQKRAAVADIFGDADKTRLAAEARGGYWKEQSDEVLVPILTIRDEVKLQRDSQAALVAAKLAELDVADKSADKVLGRGRDTVYNETGRRTNDPYFMLLYPEGLQGYTEPDTIGQPTRMGILSNLLKMGVHPRLSKETAETVAGEIDTEKDKLQKVVNELLPLQAKLDSLEATYQALARATQMALMSAKRFWRSKGESETAIHEVIPDRS